jgi:glycopeptide antibiotics resistance protein
MRFSERLTPQWRHRLFVAYAVAMLLVFLTPTPDIGVEFSYIDKAVHVGLFFGFALMFYLDRRGSPWWTLLASAILSAAVELVQWVLPFREVDFADFIAGAAGAALATVILLLYRASIAAGSPG